MQVYYEWRKVLLEFSKRMDPSLPFYYFTNNQRFYEGELPDFNEPQPKEDRPPRRELLAGTLGRWASFPVRGSLSVRAQFHNVSVSLPPPPSVTPAERLIAEHSYFSSTHWSPSPPPPPPPTKKLCGTCQVLLTFITCSF